MANNENTFSAPSVASYQALIEQEDISPITGRPSARTLISLLNQLGAAVRNIECGYSQFGYLHLILPPQLYLSLTQEVVNLPVDPGNTPNYVQGADAAANHTILLNWQLLKGQYQKHVNLNRALIAVTRSNLSADTRQAMQVLFVGGNTNTFLEYFDRLWSRYGRCTPADISQNMSSMSAAWNPAIEDWAKVVNQIQNGAIMSYYCEQPLQEHQLLHIAETIILGTGVLGQQYSEWRSKPAAERTWDNLVTFMTEKYNVWLEVSASAAEHGYGGNIEGGEAYEEAEQAYAESIRSFGQVNADNASTFNNLSGANATLLNQLAPAIQQMQAQLQGLALAVRAQPQQQPPPPAQQYRAPPAHQYQTPPNPFQQYQAPTNGGRGSRYNTGRGGRGGGRGGRGNGHGSQQQQHFGGQQPFGGMNFGGQPQFNGQQSAPNPRKYFQNWNYCWTHGCDIADWHNSASCPKPRTGHVFFATRDNMCGGSTKAIHKTQWQS
jgi:hypothetical protein